MNQVDYCCILLGAYLLWQSFLHVVGGEGEFTRRTDIEWEFQR